MLKEIKNRSVELVIELRGWFIFPIALFSLLIMLVLKFSIILLILTTLAIIRILKTHQPYIIIISFFLAVIALCISLWSVYFSTKSLESLSEEVTTDILLIKADSIDIDGDSLKCVAKNKTTKERVIVYYSFLSKDEQEKWKNIDTAVTIKGKISYSLPDAQRNLHGFDYKNYLKEKKIYRIATINELYHIKRTSVPVYDVITHIQILRRKIQLHIERTFGSTTQLYMKSMLIGVRDGDSFQFKESTSKLGITHLFNLSGIHIFFFFSIFCYFFRRIGITVEFTYCLSLIFLGSLFILSGMTTSIGRCILMISLRETNKRFYLKLSSLDIWSIVLFTCVSLHPFLLFNLAGQLTFLLTFVIIFVRTVIKKISIPILQSILFSISLGLVSAPVLIYHYYEWLYIGELLTLIFLPLVSYIILPIIVVLFLVSLIVPGIGTSILANSFDTFLFSMNSFIESMSESIHYHFTIGKLSSWQLLIIMGVSLWVISNIGRLKQNKKYILISFSIIFLILNQKYLNPFGLVAFIDVGQGDSIFIQLPFHQGNYLIDTGGRLNFEKDNWKINNARVSNASKTVIPFLKSMGVSKLDKVFITHPDEDHAGDILEIASEFSIQNLIISSGSESNPDFLSKLKKIHKSGTNVEKLLGPRTLIQSYDFFYELLYPMEVGDGSNNDSLVMLVKIKNKQLLLTGDIEEAGEQILCQYYPKLRADILKVGHHGSKSSTSELFLSQLQPSVAIISAGKNNRYQHPHSEVIETLEKDNISIYNTANQGMIYFKWFCFSSSVSDIENVK